MSESDQFFSPEKCADLHNQLLRKATENDPNDRYERTLTQRFLAFAPEFAEIKNLQELPLYRFLCLLETTPDTNERVGLLTLQMYQPDPTAFWSESFANEPGFILLYGQNNSDSPIDGRPLC